MTLSIRDAAERVLRTNSPGAPMHYRRITEIAIEVELISPGGLTPEASMNAAITTDIQLRGSSGLDPRFVSHGRGYYSLASSSGPVAEVVASRNAHVRSRLRELIAELHPQQFERLIGELLLAIGFEDIELTKYSGDGGVDLRARLSVGGVTNVRTAVQVKQWKNNVSGKTIRELRGSLDPHERGLVITLSSFTADARRDAAAEMRIPISLIDGEGLLDLLIEHELGITTKRFTLAEVNEGYFAPQESTPEEAELSSDIAVPLPIFSTSPSSEKSLSVWPLPGGSKAWKDTLDQMLLFIAERAPTMDRAVSWLLESFSRVTSPKVARGYWQVLKSFGLIEANGEVLAVTANGAEYLRERTPEMLFDLLKTKVAGIEELLSRLSHGAATTKELLEFVRQELGVSWETDAQIRFRMGWLQVLGAVRVRGDAWELSL